MEIILRNKYDEEASDIDLNEGEITSLQSNDVKTIVTNLVKDYDFVAVDNNGIVRSIDFNIPAETDKSKEENYIKIEDIVKRTNEAIMSSGLDVKRLNLNNSLFDS